MHVSPRTPGGGIDSRTSGARGCGALVSRGRVTGTHSRMGMEPRIGLAGAPLRNRSGAADSRAWPTPWGKGCLAAAGTSGRRSGTNHSGLALPASG